MNDAPMSKGLSLQQVQSLGLAVAISRLRNGEPASPLQPLPDIDVAIAAHVIGGVGLRRRRMDDYATAGGVWLETTPKALSARASLSRALMGLMRLGYLVEHRWRGSYLLTEAGLARGRTHEPHIADLDYRLWLLSIKTGPFAGKARAVPRFLPSPILSFHT